MALPTCLKPVGSNGCLRLIHRDTFANETKEHTTARNSLDAFSIVASELTAKVQIFNDLVLQEFCDLVENRQSLIRRKLTILTT
jgi:hypothetical protein